MCISVDLPEPDGPMIAVKRPRSNPVLTPVRASTAAAPSPKRRVTASATTTSPFVVLTGGTVSMLVRRPRARAVGADQRRRRLIAAGAQPQVEARAGEGNVATRKRHRER